jgi:hypothetical protein
MKRMAAIAVTTRLAATAACTTNTGNARSARTIRT